MNRRLALKQLAALGALSAFGSSALAQPQAYQTLGTKVPTEVAGKVEVIEFFSYGCPHCHDFEPLLNNWSKGLPGDVNFIKVPITFNRAEWTTLARIYYTLDVMGEAGKRGPAVFAAIHDEKRPLHREDALMEWVAGSGIDAKRFSDTYKSFGVQSKVQRANQIAAAYKVSGVPMMAVDGRYIISASTAGGYDQMLKTVDELIARSRTEKKG
ncbi:thiol:disulfide interchange protein DsbA/DsbL [Aromatoleum sp.]|uniref:thiol:disulfide interchange protein DsbA/DsbL n=1 Tax=Aromatoleum sp. TaxID=2307007 RepID=UPI002FC58A3D